MGTQPIHMIAGKRLSLALAVALGMLMTVLVSGTARAGGGCTISVDPTTVSVGGQFVVSGDFGAGAEVHVVPGENVAPPEDSEPVYTAPANQSSFSATITMGEDSEGVWTVWGLIPATECGDSALLTVNAVPDTAVGDHGWPASQVVGAFALVLAILVAVGMRAPRRQPS
jgi:hypothetical protein